MNGREIKSLPSTELQHAGSSGLDTLGAEELVDLIARDQLDAVKAVLSRRKAIALAVGEIARRIADGGRLHYVGAGSSGRIAFLDASEMPPTFGTDANTVQAHIAGGHDALIRSIEGAEDDAAAGDAVMRDVDPRDAVVGISAGGSAAFVIAALERARKKGAYTFALTCVEDSPLARAANSAIVLETGPEVLTGSTRLKAGTAQKIALNVISTAVMTRLGKVYDNLMVDVVASNKKLRARAFRLVQRLTGVDSVRAQELLDAAGGRVKVAVVMERRGVDPVQAQVLLDLENGRLRALLA